MNTTITAAALLRMTNDKRTRATRHAKGYRGVSAAMGINVARWAYANRGTEPGHRRPCETDRILSQWVPCASDWCRVVQGTPGSGKTITAARYVAERDGLLIRADECDGWGFGGGQELVNAKAEPWLMVDDFGDEKTRVGSGHIQAVIAHRSAHGKLTVCTTTLALVGRGSIAEFYGDHIESRLRPHFAIPDHVSEDLRSTAPPVTTGIDHEIEIARVSRDVEAIAGKGSTVPNPVEVLAKFAELVGIEQTGQPFADALEYERGQRLTAEQMEGLASVFLDSLGSTKDTSGVSAADKAIAWLDQDRGTE